MENIPLKVNFALVHKMQCDGTIDGYSINEVAINEKPHCDPIIYWEIDSFPTPIINWIFKKKNEIKIDIIPPIEIDIRLKDNEKIYSSEYEVITCEKIVTILVRNRHTKEISSQTQSFIGNTFEEIMAKFKTIRILPISIKTSLQKIERIIPKINIFRRK